MRGQHRGDGGTQPEVRGWRGQLVEASHAVAGLELQTNHRQSFHNHGEGPLGPSPG